MRCPHCGCYDEWVCNRDWNNRHGCGYGQCVRETHRCAKGHTWTQWTCEG